MGKPCGLGPIRPFATQARRFPRASGALAKPEYVQLRTAPKRTALRVRQVQIRIIETCVIKSSIPSDASTTVVGIPRQPMLCETLSRKARMLVLFCARKRPLRTS